MFEKETELSNQITDPPLNYPAGLSFNYDVWTPNSELLLTNVPWTSTYKDIVDFKKREDLDAYLRGGVNTHARVVDKLSYARVNAPIRINIPIGEAMKYNYIRVNNPVQPVPGATTPETYYYFILDVIHRAPNSTEIMVQLDIWQTFKWNITEYGNVFVERGHAGIANENNFQNYGRDYLTIPEGQDLGSNLVVIDNRNTSIMDAATADYDILVVATSDLLDPQGEPNAADVKAAKGGHFAGLPTGAGMYIFKDANYLQAWLNGVRDKPWIGGSIVSITLIPNITRYDPDFVYAPFPQPTVAPPQIPERRAHKFYEGWRTRHGGLLDHIPAKYRHLKKFYTFPYMALELTTFSGTPIIIRPEVWNDPDATVVERASLVPPMQRLTFHPHAYNAKNRHDFPDWRTDTGGDYIDFLTVVGSFPSVPIVNDNSNMYAGMNANSIAYGRQSADWSQSKALAGAQQSFDMANNSMGLAQSLGLTSRNLDATQTALTNRKMAADSIQQFISGTVTGGVFGAMGGPAGAAMGIGSGAVSGIDGMISTMRGMDYNTDQWAARNQAALDSLGANMGASAFARDSNMGLAQFAAKGDYENTISGINAKIQDAENAAPTTAGQAGGDALNMINGDMVVSLRFKMIDQAHIRMLGDYWCRFGYAVSAFMKMPSQLNLMTNFTYWKVTEMFIKGEGMPEPFKNAIRGIFEKGVTVYEDPDKIGFIDWADNLPKGGFTY